jgi:hypothetical protein
MSTAAVGLSADCFIAQKKSSTAFFSLHFYSREETSGTTFKSVIFNDLLIYLKLHRP